MEKPKLGSIGWIDLTVDDADRVRDFYKAVVGWDSSEVKMQGYNDYCMHPKGDEVPVSGVCHKRGSNESIPSHWVIYVVVENLDASIKQVEALGGKVLNGPREAGCGKFVIISDPAGAVCGLWQSGN